MAIGSKSIAVTTSEETTSMGEGVSGFQVKNMGSNDCYIDFDTAIDANSYILEAGEALEVEYAVVRLFHQGVSGSTTLKLIYLIGRTT